MTYSSVCKLLLAACPAVPTVCLAQGEEEDQVVDLEAGRRVVLPELRRALREPRRAEQVSPDRPERASAPPMPAGVLTRLAPIQQDSQFLGRVRWSHRRHRHSRTCNDG